MGLTEIGCPASEAEVGASLTSSDSFNELSSSLSLVLGAALIRRRFRLRSRRVDARRWSGMPLASSPVSELTLPLRRRDPNDGDRVGLVPPNH